MNEIITAIIVGYLAATLIQFISTVSQPRHNRPRYHPLVVGLLWPVQLQSTIAPLFWFIGGAIVGYILA